MCAQFIILGACVVAFVLVSLGAAWGAAIGVWVRLRIERVARARAGEIEHRARAALPGELERLLSIARGAERLVRDLRQR